MSTAAMLMASHPRREVEESRSRGGTPPFSLHPLNEATPPDGAQRPPPPEPKATPPEAKPAPPSPSVHDHRHLDRRPDRGGERLPQGRQETRRDPLTAHR